MAKYRIVNTRFWIDDYTANLDPIEKLLFLYFLTNTSTDISGVYEIPLKNIALDTGIDKEMVEKILGRFARDGKIFYSNGWVGVKNFAKHQLDNPKVQQGIKNGLAKAPKEIIDSLASSIDSLSHLNSNINSNSNLTVIDSLSATPREEAQKFFLMVEADSNDLVVFLESLNRETNIPQEIARKEIRKFCSYWTELNSTGKKQRWQTERTFEVKRRLGTWFSKAGSWSKNQVNKYQPAKI